MGFPGGSVVKNSPASVGDTGLILGSERSLEEGKGKNLFFKKRRESPGEENDNPLQYFCQGNPMDRGAWWGYSPWGCKRVRHDLATKATQ